MRSKWVLIVMLFLPVWAQAQTVGFCALGTACWKDGSGGKASTELKFTSADVQLSATLNAGITTYSFADRFKESTSQWICVQARHRYPDGKVSGWYISDTEGVCKELALVMPPAQPPPPVPPPVPPLPGNVFSNIRQEPGVLMFDYREQDCPNGTRRFIKGRETKTITITCER